ncbi:MAG: hypothetical protein EBZ23_13780 [Rhodobacteraceae bacterium]|nr:hypothetical protein [Paracoccaceae bacterium]
MTLSAINRLQRLNRTKILVQAARHGVTTYERKLHLLHLFGWQKPKSLTALLDILFEKEAELNKMRRRNDAAYQIQDHIAILTALIAEATQATARLHQMAA